MPRPTPRDRLLTPEQFAKLDSAPLANPLPPETLHHRFQRLVSEVGAALGEQAAKTDLLETRRRLLRLHLSHFIQTLNNAIERGELPASDRAYYLLPIADGAVPGLTADADLVLWAERLADGETARNATLDPPVPLAWPTIAQVTAVYTAFASTAGLQTAAKDLVETRQQLVETDREPVDVFIRSVWNTIEFRLTELGLDASAVRRRAREWDVEYTPDPGAPPEGSSSTSGGA